MVSLTTKAIVEEEVFPVSDFMEIEVGIAREENAFKRGATRKSGIGLSRLNPSDTESFRLLFSFLPANIHKPAKQIEKLKKSLWV